MVRYIPCVAFLLSAGMAQACPSFGFDTDYLSDFFCSQLDDLAGPVTRSVDDNKSVERDLGETILTHPEAEWLQLPVIQDAWRSDPAKTLRLIERIRDAGGRPLN